MISAHSEEQIINVYLNNEEISEETIISNYDQEVVIEVKTNQEEVFSTLKVVVMQNNEIIQVPVNTYKEQQSISFILPQGKNYTFQIKALHDNQEKTWSFNKAFHILEEVSILLNEMELKDYQVMKQSGLLKINDFSNIQMDHSYIVINDEKKIWKKTVSGYEYEITTPGKHELEFHFFDLNNNEFIRKNTLIIENIDMNSNYIIGNEIIDSDVLLLNKDTDVVIKSAVIEPKNLILYSNDDVMNTSWVLKDGFYQTSIKLQEEKSHHLQLFYNDGKMTLLNEKTFILDKTNPVVKLEIETKEVFQEDVLIDVYVNDSQFSMDSYISDIFENNEIKYNTWTKKDDGFYMQLMLEKEGVHTLQFHCFDLANNSAMIYENNQIIKNDLLYKIDKTPPLIMSNIEEVKPISLDKQTFRFMVKDDNLDSENIQLSLKRNQQEYVPLIKKNTMLQQTFVEFTLEDEGFYEIQLSATDYANNKADSLLYKFQLDHTKPKLVLHNLNKDISNKDVSFEISGQDETIVEYNLVVYRDDLKKDVLTYNKNFNELINFHEEDGTHNYKLELYGKDQAGNENKIVKSFIIDKEAPFIQALYQGNPYNNSILTNKSADILFSWDDFNIEKAEYLIYKNGELINEGNLTDTFLRKKINALDNRIDAYQYFVRVYDYAGNMSESKMDITLDTYLPSLELQNEYQKQIFNASYIPTLKDVQKETQIMNVTLLKDKKEIFYEWGNAIEEDGNYQLFVTVQDLAGNMGNVKPIYFEIDKTPPTIQLLNMVTKEEVAQEYEGKPFTLTIDTGFLRKDKIVSIQLNNNELLSEEVVSYDVSLKQGNHNLKVTAKDEAGNKVVKEMNVHITKDSNRFFKYSIVLLIGICLALYRKKLKCSF